MFIPHYVEDIKQERFYRVPKEFIENEYYRDQLDNNMKMMYGLLRDRYELSIANKWVDKQGVIYCIYSRENLAVDLNVSKNTVTKCIKKLTEMDLMKEVRKGLNKPNWMYVGKVQSGYAKFGNQEAQNLRPNDTDLNETEKIKRYTITSNGDAYLEIYAERFKEKYGKDHPTVTESQLQEILSVVYEVDPSSPEDFDDAVCDYLNSLPDSNDGKIFSFIGKSQMISPLRRYM